MKRFTINEAGLGTYTVAEGKTATLDMNAVFGYANLPDLCQRAIAFAVGHILRNATAGKMDDIAKATGFDEAFKAVGERITSLVAGKWTAYKETGEAGESRSSLLAQALAKVMQCEGKDAAAFIVGEIRTALEEKNIDPDAAAEDRSEEEKTTVRKIANVVRKSIASDSAVALALGELKLAALQAQMAVTVEQAKGKTSKFTGK